MGENMVEQICQNSKIDCFAGISREGITCKLLAKTNYHDYSHSSHILCTWLTSRDNFSRNPLGLQ